MINLTLKSIALVVATFACVAQAEYSTPGIEQSKISAQHGQDLSRLSVQWKASAQDKDLAQQAWSKIRSWQSQGQVDHRKLHVVYVTLKDRPALPDFKERINRIVKNIQLYYADQMEENGYPRLTFGLDLDKSNKVIVHEAYLDAPLSQFNVNSSGPATREVANEVLHKAGINPEKDYTLIIAQMPDKIGPYYGGGTSESGVCWTCDAAHLDPTNFKSEETGNFLFGTVGKDNTVYIGGTAHELGHCFSLPHTAALNKQEHGASLMGDGNYSYGEEFRKSTLGTFLIQSDALRLASIPLFTGMSRTCDNPSPAEFTSLSAKSIPHGLILSGKVQGNPPVYGLIAYFDPAGGDDYDATSSIAIPKEDGSFTLTTTRPHHKGDYQLRLVALMADGHSSQSTFDLTMDNQGKTNTDSIDLDNLLLKFKSLWKNNQHSDAKNVFFNEVYNPYHNDSRFQRSLKIWRAALENTPLPTKLTQDSSTASSEKSCSLTDVRPTEAIAGYGFTTFNYTPLDATLSQSPVPALTHFTPESFISTHAQGHITYKLDGSWKNLSLVYGAPHQAWGATQLIIRGDGQELARSTSVSKGETCPMNVSIDGIKTLTLEVVTAPQQQGINGCSGLICNPIIQR